MEKLDIEKLEEKVAKRKELQYKMRMRSLPIKIEQRIEKAIGNGGDAIRISEEEFSMIGKLVNKIDGTNSFDGMEFKHHGHCDVYYYTLQFRNFKKKRNTDSLKFCIFSFLVLLFGIYVAYNGIISWHNVIIRDIIYM